MFLGDLEIRTEDFAYLRPVSLLCDSRHGGSLFVHRTKPARFHFDLLVQLEFQYDLRTNHLALHPRSHPRRVVWTLRVHADVLLALPDDGFRVHYEVTTEHIRHILAIRGHQSGWWHLLLGLLEGESRSD